MKHSAVIMMILLVSTTASLSAAGRNQEESHAQQPSAATIGSFGVAVVDGLHVTGAPINVDVDAYRLRIGGLVEHPLSLELSEITALPAVHRSVVLVCPGVFRDEGVWTGVRLRILLDRAGILPGAATVAFRSIDGSYEQTLPLEKAMSDGVYLAYEFNGRVFDPRNGFPLRLVAEDEPGSVWVKWLGEIDVRTQSPSSNP